MSITIKLTVGEAELLTRRAAEAGLALRPFMRSRILHADGAHGKTQQMLLGLMRLEELTRRMWTAASLGDDDFAERVRLVYEEVAAIDDRVLLARSGGTK